MTRFAFLSLLLEKNRKDSKFQQNNEKSLPKTKKNKAKRTSQIELINELNNKLLKFDLKTYRILKICSNLIYLLSEQISNELINKF